MRDNDSSDARTPAGRGKKECEDEYKTEWKEGGWEANVRRLRRPEIIKVLVRCILVVLCVCRRTDPRQTKVCGEKGPTSLRRFVLYDEVEERGRGRPFSNLFAEQGCNEGRHDDTPVR